MRLKVTKTNHSNIHDWQFMLSDEKGETYYIMNSSFYERRNMKIPVSQKESDAYHNGLWITAYVEQLGSRKVVVSF